MRWSPPLATRAPRSRAPPSTSSPSGRSVIRAPRAPSWRAIAATRSDSFTRSSPASRISVVPRPSAAATASAGISSMSRGTSAPATSPGPSSLLRAVIAPIGSPPAGASAGTTSSRAPIAASASTMPVRVGLRPTPRTVTVASRTTRPATTRNAADEMSPGTVTAVARSGPGTSRIVRPSLSTWAPNCRSMRSEWSRDGAGSTTVTGPSAARPARRIADFTCAEATGRSHASAFTRSAPRMASGSFVPSARPTTVAPIRRSGSATRPIGRRRSDSSPVRTVQNGWAPSTPKSRRAVVPELPQSTTSDGSCMPRGPTPAMRYSPGPLRVTSAPSASTAAMVRRQSSASR